MPQPIQLLSYGDAAWANLPAGGSQGGHLTIITTDGNLKRVGEDRSAAIIMWKSVRIKRVVRSTFTGELLEQSNAMDSAVWIARLIEEITNHPIPVDMLTDCQSLVDKTRSLKVSVEEKRNLVDIHAIREAIESLQIRSLSHIGNQEMIADGLTKTTPKLKPPILKMMQGSIHIPTTDARDQT
jgi:hypothetical protein